MTQSLRPQFDTTLASTLLNEIQYQKSRYYYFFGKLDPWEVDDRPSTTVQPLSEYEDVKIRNNAAYFKKITPNDVSLVIPRYDWISNEIYAQWDDTLVMDGQAFYVLTDLNEVYKCLNNNSGSVSTVKPTGRNLQPFKTSDGYTWKYMYSIPQFKKQRFTTTNYMPVQRALSDSFYDNGSVESVTVIDGGSGYTDTQLTFVTVSGETTGTGATATCTVNASGGIETVTITNPGSGYTKGATVKAVSSIGTGAILRAVISDGLLNDIQILAPGVGYSAGVDTIKISVGGALIIPTISRDNGSIIQVDIIESGSGYVSDPVLTVNVAQEYLSGTGLYEGNSTAILESVEDMGSIQRVLIRDPGKDYPYSDETNIVPTGDGTGLQIIPVIQNGAIIDTVIQNPGIGYTYVNLNVIGDGTGAKLQPIFGNSDITSDQSVIEQLGVDGAIYSVVVTNNGSGYTGTTTVSITGDGTGATAHAEVLNGSITKVIMDTWGSGYTKATVVFGDPNRNNLYNDYTDATAYAIFPPGNGHGVDAVKELYGKTIIFSSNIQADQLLTDYGQDYRQFGIISQPRNIASGKLSTVDSEYNVYTCNFDNTIGMVIDEILLFGVYEYRVVTVSTNSARIQSLQKKIVEPVGQLVSKIDSNRIYNSTEILTRPIIDKHSGSLLYVSNEDPFVFSNEQGIRIKTFIAL